MNLFSGLLMVPASKKTRSTSSSQVVPKGPNGPNGTMERWNAGTLDKLRYAALRREGDYLDSNPVSSVYDQPAYPVIHTRKIHNKL